MAIAFAFSAMLAAVLTAAPAALGADFVVNPGDLQAALDQANPGDRILLNPGRYSETITVRRGGQPGAPVTVTRATGTTPVLAGPWQVRAPYVTLSRLIFDGSGYQDYPIWATQSGGGTYGSFLTLEYSEVRNARLSGVLIGDTTPPMPVDGVVIRTSYFHDNGRSPQHDFGIFIESGSAHLIEQNLIVGSSSYGVHDYPHAQGAVIRGNEIADNGGGIVIEHDVTDEPPDVNHTLVMGNYLKSNRSMGISLHYDDNLARVPTGIDNTVEDNWAAGNLGGQYGRDGTLGDSNYTRGASWSGNVYGEPSGGVLVPLCAVGPDAPCRAQAPSSGPLAGVQRCRVRSASVRMSRRGVVAVRVSCPPGARGTLRIEAAGNRGASKKRRRLALGARSAFFKARDSVLKVRLNRRGRLLVRHARRVRARATITLNGVAGARVSSRRITIRLARGPKRRPSH